MHQFKVVKNTDHSFHKEQHEAQMTDACSSSDTTRNPRPGEENGKGSARSSSFCTSTAARTWVNSHCSVRGFQITITSPETWWRPGSTRASSSRTPSFQGTCTGRVKPPCRTSRPRTWSVFLTSTWRAWRTSKRQISILSTSQSSRHPWKSW